MQNNVEIEIKKQSEKWWAQTKTSDAECRFESNESMFFVANEADAFNLGFNENEMQL